MAASWVVGCGGSTAQSPPGDAGTGPDVVSRDAAPREAAGKEGDARSTDARPSADAHETGAPPADGSSLHQRNAEVDSGLPSGVVRPSGTQLVASLNVNLEALTSDQYAVYVDTSTNALAAVPLAGGASTPIATLDSASDYVLNRNVFGLSLGAAVAFWDSTGAKLSLWTKKWGTESLSSSSTLGFLSLSADGSLVAFTDSVDPSTGNGSLVVESVDGTNRQTVIPDIAAGPTSTGAFACPPIFFFAGSTLVASSCSAGGDAGAGATLAFYSAPEWSPTVLSTTNTDVVPVPTGSAFAATGGDGLQYFPGPGQDPTLIDSMGTEPLFVPDGGGLVYAAYGQDAGSGTLRRATVAATPAIASLATIPAEFGLSLLSPDGSWLLGYSTVDMNQFTNVLSASATSAGDVTTVDLDATALLQSAGFTADGNHILYETAAHSGFGYDTVTAPSAGGAVTTLVTGGGDYFPLTGSRVILEKSFVQGNPPSYGTADMVVADLSEDGGAPRVVVSQANALWYYPTADGSKLVYVWAYEPGPLAGLWVTPIP